MLEIEITGVELIEGGIEILARAFQDGEQIGFGIDGSVDIERFKHYDPEVNVSDEVGDIVRVQPADDDNDELITKYREDPEEAIINQIAFTIGVKKEKVIGSKNIIEGKIGNTTSTFNPAASPSAPVDGRVAYGTAANQLSWSGIRSENGDVSVSNDTANTFLRARAHTVTDEYDILYRSIFGFNTASIPDGDTISSATFSVYGATTTVSDLGLSATIDRCVPASTTALADSDFNIANWDGAAQSDTTIADSSWSTSAYNDFPLNATGIANINKTGYSWFGGRSAEDLNNSAPTWSSGDQTNLRVFFADNGSNEPKLVVEHAEAPTTTFIPKIMMS